MPGIFFIISRVPSIDPSSTTIISFSTLPKETAFTLSNNFSMVLFSLKAGIIIESFMAKNIIIIPTYNEKDNIALLLEKIWKLLPDANALVVDDNSPDGTAEVVEKLKNQHPNLFLMKRAGKDGLGTAYIAAFKHVLAHYNFQTITMMDADLSHDPKYLPEMLKLSENFDLVIGSRYISGGKITKKWGISRRLLSAAGNFYLRIIFHHYPIKDWSTGYNVIKTDVLKKIKFEELNPRGYAFISSLKYRLAQAGASVKESPIFFEERNGGESKMSLFIILEGLILPWKIIFQRFFH